MKYILLIVGTLILAGCETATPMRGPSGEQLMFIDCSTIGNLDGCYQKAQEVCPRGYRVVNLVNETHAGLLQTTHTTNITIDCT